LVGPEGQSLKKLRFELQKKCKRFRLSYFKFFDSQKICTSEKIEIQVFVRQSNCSESDAQCIASFVVTEVEKRIPFRRVLRIAQERAQNLGKVRGLRLQISGRLNGAEIARTEWVRSGRVPLHTISADLDYASKNASTIYGLLGVKVWIFRPVEKIKSIDLIKYFYISDQFMLSPKRVKYRKPYRGRLSGKALRGNLVSFGDYGLQAIQPAWITSRQIEARRRVLTRYVRRRGKLWIRVFPDKTITRRAAETRIGSGKGRPDYWVAVIKPGMIIFELRGISETLARQAIRIASSKLPTKAQFVLKTMRK
jgi:large subunit ribosomal protein L16